MSGYVYLIGTPIFGWYKIGKSITPEVRVKDLGILLPFKVYVIGVWKADNHHMLETTLHQMYDSSRINGEWFEFSRSEAKQVFDRLPSVARIYPINGQTHIFDKFSNITEDKKNNNKVIGVRVQKLRGDFSPEEREQRRIASIKRQKEKKLTKQSNQASSL